MKCSLGISNFLKEISSLPHSIVFLYVFALITEEGFLISPCYSLELCIQMGISYLFKVIFMHIPLEGTRTLLYLFTTISWLLLLCFCIPSLFWLATIWICPFGLPWWLRRVCLQCGRPRFDSWVGKIPWRRKWQSTPVLLPGKSHGQRSLVGYSPWGHKQLNMTERLHFHFHFLLYSGKAKEAEGSLFPTNKKWGTWKGFAPWPQRSCSISMRLFYFSVWDLCYSCPMLTKDQQNKYYLI